MIFFGTLHIKTLMTQKIMISFQKFWKTLMFLQFLKREHGTMKRTTDLLVFYQTYLKYMKDVSTDKCQDFFMKSYPSTSVASENVLTHNIAGAVLGHFY